MNDNKRKLYDALSQEYDLGTFEQFESDIADAGKRRRLYDATINDYDFGDYDSFSSQLGFVQQAQEVAPQVKPYQFGDAPAWQQRMQDVKADAGLYPVEGGIYKNGDGYARTNVPYRTQEYTSIDNARAAEDMQRRAEAMNAYKSAYNRLEGGDPADEKSLIEWGNNIEAAPIEQRNLYNRVYGKEPSTRVELDAFTRAMNETRNGLENAGENANDLAVYLSMPAERRAQLSDVEKQKYEEVLKEMHRDTAKDNMSELQSRLSGLMEKQRAADIKMHEEYRKNRSVGGFFKDALMGIPVAETPQLRGYVPSSVLEASPEGRYSQEQNDVLTAAGRKYNAAQDIISAAKNGNLMTGLTKALNSMDTWTPEQMMRDSHAIKRVVDKFDDGEKLTENEQALLDALALQVAVADLYKEDISNWYSGGEMIGEMAPFMIEMFVNPLSGLGRKAADKVTRMAVKKYGKELVKQNAKKFALARGAAKLGGSVAGGYGMALTTGLPSVTADVQQRELGQATYGYDEKGDIKYTGQAGRVELPEAVGDAVTSRMLDNASEMFGASYVNAPFKWLQRAGKGTKYLGWIDNFANSKYGKMFDNFFTKTGYHGPIEEFLEEVHVGLLNPALVGDQTLKEFFTKDNLATIAIGVAVPGAVVSTARFAGGLADGSFKMGAQELWKMESADRAATQLWRDAGRWRDLRNTLTVETIPGIEAKLNEVYADPTLTPEEKKMALEYAVYNLQYRTARGMAEGMNEGAKSQISEMLRGVYGTAFAERVSPAMANKSFKAMEEAGKKVVELTGIKDVSIEDWRGSRTNEEAAHGDQEILDALNAYDSAKADFEGRRDRYLMDKEKAYWEGDMAIDGRANNGMVYSINTADGTAFITAGNVALNDEGEIDYVNSEGLVAMYPDGSKKPVRKGDLQGVVTVENSEDLKAAKRTAIDEKWKLDFDAAENAPVEVADNVRVAADNVRVAMSLTPDEDVDALLANNSIEELAQGDQAVADALNAYVQAKQNPQNNAGVIETPTSPVVESSTEEVVPASGDNVSPVETAAPKTALEQIPRNEKNIPLYEQVDSELAWDGVVEEAGGNEETAMVAVNSMVEDKKKALAAAEKAKAKAGVTIAEKIAAENERVVRIEKAKADLAKWEEIAGVKAKRAAVQAENVAQPVAETASVVESAPVENNTPQSQSDSSPALVEQPTPQATNEMQPVSEGVTEEHPSVAAANSGRDTVGGSPVALAYLLEGGQGSILNAGYFLHGVAAAFPAVNNEIETLRGAMSEDVLGMSPTDFVAQRADEIAQIGELITNAYGEAGAAIYNELLNNASGFVPRVGAEVGARIEALQPLNESTISQTSDQVSEEVAPTAEEIADAENEGESQAESEENKEEAGLFDAVTDVTTPEEFIALHLPKLTPESFKAETGLSNHEQRQMVGFIAKKENGGVSVERASELLMDGYGDELKQLGFHGDDTDVRNIIIDILQEGNPRSYVKKVREQREAERLEYERAQADVWAKEQGFESIEEMEAYEEQLMEMYKAYGNHAQNIAAKLGVEVTVHNDESTVTNRDAMKAIAEGGEVKGWYNPSTGEIALFLPSMESMKDVEGTILHEAVAHYGIKRMLGKEKFNEFLDQVWEMMPVGTRAHYLQYVGADMKAPTQELMRAAADEYVAYIAEGMNLTEVDKSIWDKILEFFIDSLAALGFKNLTRSDVERVIKASYRNLALNKYDSQVTSGSVMQSKKVSERREEKNRINNVLDEVGGIIYGNKEYAKKQRLKREAERKELAKEIYSSVLKGDFTDVTLSQIDKFIEDATPANPFGRRISQRLPQRMERALRQGARTNAVDALFSRICESAVPANERFSEAGRREIEERKKELLKGWAIATGNWYTDLKEFTDDTEPIGEGKDSKVYMSKDGNSVIKASKGKPFGKKFRPDIDNIPLFNDVFKNSRYEILGYGEIDGQFVRILKQDFIDFAESTPLTPEERVEYMGKLGFKPLNKDYTAFSNGEIVIADLQKSNIVKDAAGNISVIDADAKLHTKDVGGDYTYPPVETDLPEGTDLSEQRTMFSKVTPEMDAEYMAAVENGDMETAERMVKEAAKMAMPDTKVVDEDGYPMVVYHRTPNEFTAFDKEKIGASTDAGAFGSGFYLSPADFGSLYGKNLMPLFVSMKNPLMLNDTNAFDTKEPFFGEDYSWGKEQAENFSTWVKNNGYDGVWYENNGRDEIVATEPNQMKSADPVTYDNQGNVIPLSERFNEEKEDIRFSKVFHGSGAQFDRFDHAFMGTGEGAQVFGWGTYVTEVEGIGRTYAGVGVTKLGSLQAKLGNIDSAISSLEKEVQRAEKDLTSDNETARHIAAYTLDTASERRKALEEEKAAVEEGIKPYRNLYTVEIPDDNGSNYLHWEERINGEIQERIANGLQSIGFEFEPEMNHLAYSRDGKIAVLNINAKGKDLYAELSEALGGDKAASLFLNNLGFVGISYPAEAMTGGRDDGAKNYVIFNENDAVIEDRTMFRRANKNQEIFVSNAQRAVEDIKQEKATPEQWIAMLKKNGGLKAGEEAWLGLEEWLNEKQGAVTKQEILDFIGENKIQIEEVRYSQFGYGMLDEAAKKLEAETKEIGWDAMQEKYPGIEDFFEYYNGEVLWNTTMASIGEYEDFVLDNKIVYANPTDNAINESRESYTTEGLERKREIALTVPTIEPYNASDEVHFGDAGNGRAVAWVRFGETTDSEGNRVLVIDEIQSKRHQDGREKGYRSNVDKFLKDNGIEVVETDTHIEFYKNGEIDKRFAKALFNTDIEKAKNLYVAGYEKTAVPSAPFEKNWHELAMKRMLRLAAEEGFDKVAWTTGEQQAERYNLGAVLKGLKAYKTSANEYYVIPYNNGAIGEFVKEYTEQELADTFGKELAQKIITNAENATEENPYEIEGEEFRFGGEGMKGFYDRMLPSFVSKYTKKWGAKVGEVTMPNLRENNTMHSVDVTPEMKESVMEGQTMFRFTDADRQAIDFRRTHKGSANIVVIDTDMMTADLLAQGFNAEEIVKIRELHKKGSVGFYSIDRNTIYLLGKNLGREENEGTFWHENTHKAIVDLDVPQEILDEFYSMPSEEFIKKFEELAIKGYNPEDYPEEFMAYYIEHVRDSGRHERSIEIMGVAPEKVERVAQIVEPIINYISYGRRRVDTGTERVSKESGNLRDSGVETLREGEKAERATAGVTEGRIATESVVSLAEKLNTPARVVTDVNSLEEKDRDKKGWYNLSTGEVVLVMDNHASTEDALETVLHEVVGHKGLREMLGEEFDGFLDKVYKNAPEKMKAAIRQKVSDSFVNGPVITVREATEEYIAELAEKGFEGYNGVWNAIKQWLRDILRKFANIDVTDGELRYILWKSYNRQQDVITRVRGVAMEAKTDTGNKGKMYRRVSTGGIGERYDRRVKGTWNGVKEGWYDATRSIRVAQEEIEAELGREIIDSANVYDYANHIPSINRNKMERFNVKHIRPFMDFLKEVKGVASIEDLERYANAKHGFERNREMSVRKAMTEVQDGKKVFNQNAYDKYREEVRQIRANGNSWEKQQEELDRLAESYGAKIKDHSGFTAMFAPAVGAKAKYADLRAAALAYVKEMEAKIDNRKFWKLVKGINNYSLKENYESGLLSKKNYENIADMYEYYVPLRGFHETTAEDVYEYVTENKSVLNSVVKSAHGRESQADDIFATMLNMANSAIVYGSKNRLKQRLLNLALMYKTPLLSVSEAWYRKIGDSYQPEYPNITEGMTPEQVAEELARFEEEMKAEEKKGNVERLREGLDIKYRPVEKWDKNQHAVPVKRNGKEYIVYVNASPKLAQALNGLLIEEPIKGLGWLETVNQWRAKAVTGYSPDFVARNLVRDFQSSTIVYSTLHGAKAGKDFDVNAAKILPQIHRLYWLYNHDKLDANNKFHKYFKEFLENGGETGYTEMISIEEYNKKMREHAKGITMKNAAQKGLSAVADAVEFANQGVENVCRFAAYLTSREAGISILKSVNDAKEVSVNFNRKGSGAYGQKLAKTCFMFLNPAIQAAVQRATLAVKAPKRMIPVFATEFVIGAALPVVYSLIYSMISGDDDDEVLGNYYNLTNFARRANICLPTGDGVITIPLSHESRVFFSLGEILTSTLTGHTEYDDIYTDIFNSFAQVLPINPVEGWAPGDNILESMVLNLTPDAVKPIIEVVVNKDFAGNRVHNRSDYNEFLPEYKRASKGTPEAYVSISKFLTGGKHYGANTIDETFGAVLNPSSIEHLAQSYAGGLYTFISNFGKSVAWAAGDEEFAEFRNIPIANGFYKSMVNYEPNPTEERTRRDWEKAYRFYQEEVKDDNNSAKDMRSEIKAGNKEAEVDYDGMISRGEILRIDIFNDGADRVKELYTAKDEARKAEDYDRMRAIDQDIYAEKRRITERMEQLKDDPMSGYDMLVGKTEGVYGELETYGDKRDVDVINEFQNTIKPVDKVFVSDEAKELWKALNKKEDTISAIKKKMERNPDSAEEKMMKIRTLRAEAVELINKYRNE